VTLADLVAAQRAKLEQKRAEVLRDKRPDTKEMTLSA
jgi:hypothetical protein